MVCKPEVTVRDVGPDGLGPAHAFTDTDAGKVRARMSAIFRGTQPGLARRIADHTQSSECGPLPK